MLLVWRSELDWQLAKCPLQEVNMWPMCKSISFWEEEDICEQRCIINSNHDDQWYCTLVQQQHSVYTSWLYSIGTRDAVSIIMGLEWETPTHSYRVWLDFCLISDVLKLQKCQMKTEILAVILHIETFLTDYWFLIYFRNRGRAANVVFTS